MLYPWKALSSWAPFEIDALGLLTLLGANEVDLSVGRLAPSYWLEYMPLLAGFVFAGDRFRTKQPTFTLYNISSGIVTGNLAAWFTRWMQAQDFQVSRSLVYWEVEKVPQSQWRYFFISALVSFTCNGFLLAMTILSGDWYGFTTAIAMILLIGVRSYMLQANRNAINRAVRAARPLPTTLTGAIEDWKKKEKENKKFKPDPKVPRPDAESRKWRPEVVKILVVMPDSRAVAMFIPEHLLRPAFVTETSPKSPGLYRLAQWIGWVAFTVHVITLGMAQLATQLYVIVLTVIPTVLICYGLGCDDSRLWKGWRRLRNPDATLPYVFQAGTHLKATVLEWPQDMEFARDSSNGGTLYRRHALDKIPRGKRSTARQDLYAWFNLSPEEEKSLWDWHLLPHSRDHDDSWWKDFRAKKGLVEQDPPNIRAFKEDCIRRELEGRGGNSRVFCPAFRVTGDIEKGYKK